MMSMNWKLMIAIAAMVLSPVTALLAQNANNLGYLNVITGLPEAEIYVDGDFVAKDSVKKKALEAGEHYVRIIYNNKLMYAKLVEIYPGEIRTITSENFVDIRTSAPNRGALEREARRLTETKGTVGLGVMAGTQFPASGISVKWLASKKIGLQASGMAGLTINNIEHTQFGIRAIIPVGNKILGNTTVNGYIAPGYARVEQDHQTIPGRSFKAHTLGLSLGVEWAPFDPIYFSGEVSTAYRTKDGGRGNNLIVGAAVGVHVFF